VRPYLKFHIALLTLALGLAAVFMLRGMSIAWSEVPVDLPVTETGEVIRVQVADRVPHSGTRLRKFYCQDGSTTENKVCLDQRIFGDRDMDLFEKGGEFDATNLQSLSEARRFVWDHWKRHKPGYLSIAHSGADFEWTDHLFIESEPSGKWRVALRTVPIPVLEEFALEIGDIHSVERKRATGSEAEDYGFKPGTQFLELSDDTDGSLVL
jgi:hypothetical protein